MNEVVRSQINGSLWFTSPQVIAARHQWAQGHPLSIAIMQRAHDVANDAKSPCALSALAAIALIERDQACADLLVDRLFTVTTYAQDLGLAHRALQLAVAYECAGPLLDTARMAAVRQAAAEVVIKLRSHTSSHNPHAVQNNWWGVTHGGALLAAFVADHDGDHEEEIRWALGRCLAFCHHFGTAGLFHEGLGYQMYTLSHLLPALVAADYRGYIDLALECPWITRLAESLFAATGLRSSASDQVDDDGNHQSMMLSWNDAGLQWQSGIVSPLMLRYADPQRQGTLINWSTRLEGHLAAQSTLYGEWEGWPFALVFLTESVPPASAPLRRHISDPRQGLAIFRDRWCDGDDAVLGCYARATHIGGHSHDDGGSIRFMALGQQWILGGGQARGQAQWQSVVTPVESEVTTKRKAGLGAVLWDEGTDHGGVFAMDLRRVSGAYHERYCALGGNARFGAPVVTAFLDVIDDHLGRAWTWRITIAPELQYHRDDDGAGFVLLAQDGTQAHVRFLGTRPNSIREETCPESQRTFSNGKVARYSQRPVIAADFPALPHLAIYAVMTVSRGNSPLPTITQGVDVRIGDAHWQRPFSVAVPANYDLDLAGTLCRWPSGRAYAPADAS
jgi:hypothetical protein